MWYLLYVRKQFLKSLTWVYNCYLPLLCESTMKIERIWFFSIWLDLLFTIWLDLLFTTWLDLLFTTWLGVLSLLSTIVVSLPKDWKIFSPQNWKRLIEFSQCGWMFYHIVRPCQKCCRFDKAMKGHLQGVFVDERTVVLSLHGNEMMNVSA